MDMGQALQAGEAFAKAHLEVIEAAYGAETASSYAAGYVAAARQRFIEKFGAQSTWEYFFDNADAIMDWKNKLERAGEV